MGRPGALKIIGGDRAGIQRPAQPAGLHQSDGRRHFAGTEQIVGGHQDRRAAVTLAHDQLMELGRSGRVQAGRRFIKEQRPGFLDDGQRDAHLLAHALGVEPDAPPECLRRQPGGPERVLQPCGRTLLHRSQPREVIQVFIAGQFVIQRHVLRDVQQAPAHLLWPLPGTEPINLGGSGGRFKEAQEQLDRCRLAGPVCAQPAEALAGAHREAHIIQRPMRAVFLDQMSCSQHV
ncbi:hypothetical protein G6F68_010313 [Rhizopus microsporus]|nr:hypothetical protein G6F68_010313 [Rhizopus microsporus]